MKDFNNTNPVKLDPITVRMIENRSFRNWQEPNILKINHLISEFADPLNEAQFANILLMNGYSVQMATQLSEEVYSVQEDVAHDYTLGVAEGINIAKSGAMDETAIHDTGSVGSEGHGSCGCGEEASSTAEAAAAKLHEAYSGISDTVKSWGLQERFKKVYDTVSDHASKASDSVQEAAKSKSVQFVKKHGATITVTILCRRFGLSPEVAQEIIRLFKD